MRFPLSDPLLIRLESLLDRVLMTPAESGEDEFSCVRMSRVDGETGTFGDGIRDGEDIAEIQFRSDPLGIQVQSQSHEINVPRSFSVPEHSSFDSIGSCKDTQLGSRNGASWITKSPFSLSVPFETPPEILITDLDRYEYED
jgi:hypothetical protein